MNHPARGFPDRSDRLAHGHEPAQFRQDIVNGNRPDPAKFVERARIDAARYYLERTKLPLNRGRTNRFSQPGARAPDVASLARRERTRLPRPFQVDDQALK